MTTIPERIVAGDSVQWHFATPSYAPPDWTLTYTLTSAIGSSTIAGGQVVANGGGWDVTLTAAETTALAAIGTGAWEATAHVTNGALRHTVAAFRFELYPDPAGLALDDPRTYAEIVLEAVEAVIAGVATQRQRSHSIGGVTLELQAYDDLIRLRNQMRIEADDERDKIRRQQGKPSLRRARVIR